MNVQNAGKSYIRRRRAYLDAFGATQLHLRSPWVVAFWSAMFPGLGHLLLSKYLRGFILFIWEIAVNDSANLNEAILYSFTGRFDMAKAAVDKRWLLLYVPTYLFAVWDSYRAAVDMNSNFKLAAREDASLKPSTMNAVEVNYLDKRIPWVSAAWSALAPGAGQLYIHRIITALFVIAWWIFTIYMSKLLPAIHYTSLGQFELARKVIDEHWVLNASSLYFFAVYDAYVNAVENNKLYEWEQKKFFNRQYQNRGFKMPFSGNPDGGDEMYVISTFNHSRYLELAVTAIQSKGVKKESIVVAPMDKRIDDVSLFDTIHHSDGMSLLDLPFILATILTLFGGIYGFILWWGPLIWGLIGMFTGFGLGLLIKLLMVRKSRVLLKGKTTSEVVVIIECMESQVDMVKDVLWQNFALGVRKLDLKGNG